MLAPPWDQMSIESLLTSAAKARDGRVFLRDCPARSAWSTRPPAALDMPTFLKDARFFAQQMQSLGLSAGESVLLVLPNGTESYIAIFGALFAGLIPAIAPVDEGPEFLRAAAERCSAAAIITIDRVADLAIGDKVRQVAARVLGIRCVAGFGSALPDGVVPLEGWADDDVHPLAALPPRGQDSPALITFARENGIVTAALRTEGQLIAEMLAIAAACRLDGTHRLVSLMQPGAAASFIVSGLFPIFAGAEVQLLGPFDRAAFASALESERRIVVFGPATFISALSHQARPEPLGGLIGLQHAQSPRFSFVTKGTGAASLVVDFQEVAMVAFAKWPDTPECALVGPQQHPMVGALPADVPWLIFDAEANERQMTGDLHVTGPGAASIIRRSEAAPRAA